MTLAQRYLDSKVDGYILTEVRGLRYTFPHYGGVV